MALLAFDTATQILAVAIGQGEKTLLSSTSLIARGHSRLLQPMVEQLMKNAGVGPQNIEGIVVGVGPGSYTGVRLGVTTAKAMATALCIPVYPVSTLAAMAVSAVPAAAVAGDYTVNVLSLLYARRGRAFGALYRRTGNAWSCLVSPQVLPFDEWGQKLALCKCLLVHDLDGFRDGEEWLRKMGTELAGQVPIAIAAPAVGPALLRLAHRQELGCTPRSGEDVHDLVPDYALRVEAEVKQEKGSVGGAG